MPELPEVETTLRGIEPYIINVKITDIQIRHPTLRWPIPLNFKQSLIKQKIIALERRGKYLLFKTAVGTIIVHLGMSGSLRILTKDIPAKKHDHLDIEFANHVILRFTDPRRFGAVLWTTSNPQDHPLLKNLGLEPLDDDFTGDYLWKRSRHRKLAIKSFIMDNKIVVGVGNIYATEALFAAAIPPFLAAGKVSRERYVRLAKEIKNILLRAIKQGGTTLKDFVNSNGNPGYFAFHLKAYGRKGLPCVNCKTILKEKRIGQRSTVYCPYCQS